MAALDVAPQMLNMPTPEQLGVPLTPDASADADWANTRHRLTQLGAVSFNLERLSDGCHRFTCFLPTSNPGMTHRIEVKASNEAEAIRLALASAEEWERTK
jgi:hypothetical protein